LQNKEPTVSLNDLIKLVVSILACFAAAGIGSLFTFKAIPNWYTGLKKPP
jgi:tryptophan-rich sensory protein